MKGMFCLPHFSTVMSSGHLEPKLSKTYFWILASLFSISENDNPTPPPPAPPFPLVSISSTSSHTPISNPLANPLGFTFKMYLEPCPLSPCLPLCPGPALSDGFLPVLPAST